MIICCSFLCFSQITVVLHKKTSSHLWPKSLPCWCYSHSAIFVLMTFIFNKLYFNVIVCLQVSNTWVVVKPYSISDWTRIYLVSFLTHLCPFFFSQQVTICADKPCKYVAWRRKKLYLLFAKHRYIAKIFALVVRSDIAEKLYSLNNQSLDSDGRRYDLRLPSYCHMLATDLEKTRVPTGACPNTLTEPSAHRNVCQFNRQSVIGCRSVKWYYLHIYICL